ncbi:hypothetical protein CSB20_00535, partial [bacterium DOLZORAL124_64_63]
MAAFRPPRVPTEGPGIHPGGPSRRGSPVPAPSLAHPARTGGQPGLLHHARHPRTGGPGCRWPDRRLCFLRQGGRFPRLRLRMGWSPGRPATGPGRCSPSENGA